MIAITGASGFLGKHLSRDLTLRCIPHRCLVRRVLKDPVKAAVPSFATYVQVDYDQQTSVDRALDGCTVLIHFLGLINGTEELLHRVNVEYSQRIIKAAKMAGIQRIIWVSSVAAMRRHGFYGITKFEGEKAVCSSGIPFTILRPAFIYGSDDKNNTAMLVRTLKHYPIVPLLGGGDFKLQPVYIDDVISLIQAVLQGSADNGSYTVAGPNQISLKEMLLRLAIELRRKPIFLPLPLKPIQILVGGYLKLFPKTRLPAKQILELDKHESFDIGATSERFNFYPRKFSDGVAAMFKAVV